MADILVIDDMAGVRRVVSLMLKSSGHNVTAAEDGTQGLALLKQRRFDLVITDMMMPVLDGTEVIAQLCALPRRPPVIALSGGGSGVSADSALRAVHTSADAYLEKPFERADLISVVDRLLARTTDPLAPASK